MAGRPGHHRRHVSGEVTFLADPVGRSGGGMGFRDPFAVAKPVEDSFTKLALRPDVTLEQLEEHLAKDGVSVNDADPALFGKTPLLAATSVGRADLVDWLLAKGADCNVAESDGSGPLHLGVSHEGLLRRLVEAGADLEAQDSAGMTPLSLAVAGNKAGAVKELLELGATVHAKVDVCPDGLLTLAVKNSTKEVVEMLLQRGADPNERNDAGETALHVAASNNRPELVPILLAADAVEVDALSWTKTSPLHEACRGGFVDIALMLGRAGADFTLPCEMDDGFTALHYAARAGAHEVVATAAEEGLADPNLRDSEGRTCLHVSRAAASDDLVALCSTKGIDLDATSKWGSTALHVASHNGRGLLVEALATAGADVNFVAARDLDTPLHWAAAAGRYSCAVALVKAGADLLAKDRFGANPLDVARMYSRERVISLLENSALGATSPLPKRSDSVRSSRTSASAPG